MKKAVWVLLAAVLFSVCFAASANAQSGNVYLKEEFSYAGLDQMQAAGWTFTRPAGISVASSAVTLDGTGGDCAMHHSTSFSTDVLDWKAEVRSMWLGQGHSVLSVFVYTEHHSYGWAADGYYKEFSLYRDSKKILHFGNYAERANEYVVLTMVREGSTFSFYFNGALINTYTEEDIAPSKVTGLGLVSPWRGDAKYDYVLLGEPTAASPTLPSTDTSSFPTTAVLIGGGIAAVVVGGVVVYYFVVAGGHAGASAGSAAVGGGAEGAGGTTEGGGGSVIQEHPISPLGQAGVSSGVSQASAVAGAQTNVVGSQTNVAPSGQAGVGSSGQTMVGGGQTGVAPSGQAGVSSGVSQASAVAGAQTNVVGSQTNVAPSGQAGVGNRSVDLKKVSKRSETVQGEESSDSKA